jgi:hypothetical protein
MTTESKRKADFDSVLRRMLSTPPEQHKKLATKNVRKVKQKKPA